MRTSLPLTVNAVLSVVLLCAIVDISDAQTNYCAASLCPGTKHIGCNNKGAFGPKCEKNAHTMPITHLLKDIILGKHNTFRNNIAEGRVGDFKPAARMATIQWDKELESLALLNVKHCELWIDACRATPKYPFPGQSVSYSAWTGTDETKSAESIVEQHLMNWYNEYKDASMARMDRYSNNGKFIGHFAQMIMERATYLGCGIVRHTKSGKTYQYMACNYAFGTFLKHPVYESASEAGSKCETGTNSSYTSLCSINEVYDVKNVKQIQKQ